MIPGYQLSPCHETTATKSVRQPLAEDHLSFATDSRQQAAIDRAAACNAPQRSRKATRVTGRCKETY